MQAVLFGVPHGLCSRAAAQSTVTLELPARRGGFYDCIGLPLTGLEKRWLALCFPGQENYTRLYACTDTAGQELLYRSRSRAAPFLVEVDRDMTALGIPCYAASRRYAAAPLCPQLLGYLDGEGHGAAGLEKALDALLTGSGARDTLLCPVTAQGTLRTGEQVQHLQADSGGGGPPDPLPFCPAGGRGGGGADHDHRLHSGAGRPHGSPAGLRQCAGF